MTDAPQASPSAISPAQQYGLITALLLVDSMHYVFARLLLPYVGPPLSVLYVLGVSLVEVGLFGWMTGRLRLSYARQHWRFFSAIGLCVGISTILNYQAVAFIDPGTAAMLGKTTVVFGLGFGFFWLKDRLTRLQQIGSGIALAGLVVITYAPGNLLSVGALLVIGSTFLYAFHAALTKRYAQEMDLLNFFFYRLLFTTGVIFAIVAASGNLALPASGWAWFFLILTGTVDVVISRSLYYFTLRRLNISVFSIVLTASPVAAVLWSLLLFNTFPSPRELMGGAAVLVGVALVTAAPLINRRWRQRMAAGA